MHIESLLTSSQSQNIIKDPEFIVMFIKDGLYYNTYASIPNLKSPLIVDEIVNFDESMMIILLC